MSVSASQDTIVTAMDTLGVQSSTAITPAIGTPIPKSTISDDTLHLLEHLLHLLDNLEIIKTNLQKGKGMNRLKEIEGVITQRKARHYM